MSDRDAFQVVEVVAECRLRNGHGREHMYWRRDGSSLAPGFYVVHWPPGANTKRFHENAVFEGPFRERRGAEAALPRIAALVASEDPGGAIDIIDDRPPRRFRKPT